MIIEFCPLLKMNSRPFLFPLSCCFLISTTLEPNWTSFYLKSCEPPPPRHLLCPVDWSYFSGFFKQYESCSLFRLIPTLWLELVWAGKHSRQNNPPLFSAPVTATNCLTDRTADPEEVGTAAETHCCFVCGVMFVRAPSSKFRNAL